MTVAVNKALVRRYLELYQTGDLRIADEIIAPSFVDHAHPEMPPGPEGVKHMVGSVGSAFSDTTLVVEDMIGEGDIVAFRFTLTGAHAGPFAGIAPTGRRFTLGGMDFVRVAEGKLIELWSAQDTLSLLRQLGATIRIPDDTERG
jgi:predicted ester cyclase